MSNQETGPVYGVPLIDTLPIGTSAMLQQMPSRADLEQVRKRNERAMTNEQLGRRAAERLANEGQLRGTEAFAERVIAEVYADAAHDWIPCSERLPGDFEPVMFVMSRRSHRHVCCGYRDNHGLWLDYIDQDELGDACVDCWRELPPLPKPPEATK